jgi:hypothetical protein
MSGHQRLALLPLVLAACVAGPPLRVKPSTGGVRIDVATLGEYPTTIWSVRVSEVGSGALVWEVQAKGGMQIWGFDLHDGANPTKLTTSWGVGEVIVPRGAADFVLRSDVAYVVQVCATASARSCRQAPVQVGSRKSKGPDNNELQLTNGPSTGWGACGPAARHHTPGLLGARLQLNSVSCGPESA